MHTHTSAHTLTDMILGPGNEFLLWTIPHMSATDAAECLPVCTASHTLTHAHTHTDD